MNKLEVIIKFEQKGKALNSSSSFNILLFLFNSYFAQLKMLSSTSYSDK